MAATPIVISPAAPQQPIVVAGPQSVFSQILIGACAGVVAWWLIEVLREVNEDEG